RRCAEIAVHGAELGGYQRGVRQGAESYGAIDAFGDHVREPRRQVECYPNLGIAIKKSRQQPAKNVHAEADTGAELDVTARRASKAAHIFDGFIDPVEH